jgi:hypothetical protein
MTSIAGGLLRRARRFTRNSEKPKVESEIKLEAVQNHYCQTSGNPQRDF